MLEPAETNRLIYHGLFQLPRLSALKSGLANLRGDIVQLESAIRLLGGNPGAAPGATETLP